MSRQIIRFKSRNITLPEATAIGPHESGPSNTFTWANCLYPAGVAFTNVNTPMSFMAYIRPWAII